MKSNFGADELVYVIYARKSSESKEKQEASIGDQLSECKEYIAQKGIRVIAINHEEKSAFKPHKRPVFDEIIRLVKSGKVNGIISWKENRICRNPEEGGLFIQLLQDRTLKEFHVVSSHTIYTPESDHLMLQIHFGMANQYSRNLSEDVKRGLKKKAADRHEYPRRAILGFEGFGEEGHRNIRPHPLEAPLIREAFQLAATGVYSLGHILEVLHNKGLRTKHGKFISKSHLFTILTCPTYYGWFYQGKELFEGNYEPIITKGLFDLVQEKLRDRSKPKNSAWLREYIRLFRCGTCGCAITTTVKRKYVKSIGEYRYYTYHHCTKRRGNCQELPLSDAELKDLVLDFVDRISISKEVWELGMELVKAKHADEINQNKRALQYANQQNENIRDQINRLIEMRANNELTKEEFLEQKDRLVNKLNVNRTKISDSNESMKTWLELMEEFFNTAFQIRDIMLHGSQEQKQNVLMRIGGNFLIKERRLDFSLKKPFDVLLKIECRTTVLRD